MTHILASEQLLVNMFYTELVTVNHHALAVNLGLESCCSHVDF